MQSMNHNPSPWPFPPRLLDYPSLPPGVKRLPAPRQPRPPLPTEPALF